MLYVYMVIKYSDYINKLVIFLEYRYSLMLFLDIEERVLVIDVWFETSRRSCEVGRRIEFWNDC